MNTVYIYEGDFESLLTLILYCLKYHIKPEKIKNSLYMPNLLEESIHLDIPKDENIFSCIIKGLGYYNFKLIYYVFLSEEEEKELCLYYFIKNGLKYRKKIYAQRNLKCVQEVLRISQYVFHEIHKMKGFLRFRELENHVLYAEIEPENNILFHLSMHFQKRLSNEYWMIKDVKRGMISCYNKKNFVIVAEEKFHLKQIVESKNEQKYEELWKTFYQTIGIEERKNERCRQNFMPKKYWKYITEMRDLI